MERRDQVRDSAAGLKEAPFFLRIGEAFRNQKYRPFCLGPLKGRVACETKNIYFDGTKQYLSTVPLKID